MNRTAIGAVIVVVLSFAACSSSDDGESGGDTVAGVDRGKLLSNLTTADQTALCGWVAPKLGGYGATSSCEITGLDAPADLDDCLYGFPTCEVTVGNLTDCYTKLVAAQNACTQAAATSAISSAACQASVDCFYY